jgi:hypothetical protein
VSPVSEPSTPGDGPPETLAEFIARMHRMQHEQRLAAGTDHRDRRRGVAAVVAGAVVVLALLLGVGWLVLPGWQPSRPARVSMPMSAPGETFTPAMRQPGTGRVGHGVGDVEPTMASETRDIAAIVREPPGPPPPAAEVKGQPPPAPSPREEPDQQPEPEPTTQPPSTRTASSGHEVAAHIAAERLADGLTSYTVRLYERDGRPVTGATVSIRGRGADGELEEATLDPGAEAGLYRGVVRFTVAEARLRIASVGRVQEIPLPDFPG